MVTLSNTVTTIYFCAASYGGVWGVSFYLTPEPATLYRIRHADLGSIDRNAIVEEIRRLAERFGKDRQVSNFVVKDDCSNTVVVGSYQLR